jgi:nitroreductase
MKIQNPVIESILSRRSIRAFTGEQVDEEALLAIAQAGLAAPSATNGRPRALILVRRRDLLDRLCDALPYAKMLSTAAAAFVVCGLPEKNSDGAARFWTVDCAATTENILLAINSLGLGAVWTAVYPMEPLVEAVRGILDLPKNVIPLNVVPVGVPAAPPEPRDLDPLDEYLHRETW